MRVELGELYEPTCRAAALANLEPNDWAYQVLASYLDGSLEASPEGLDEIMAIELARRTIDESIKPAVGDYNPQRRPSFRPTRSVRLKLDTDIRRKLNIRSQYDNCTNPDVVRRAITAQLAHMLEPS